MNIKQILDYIDPAILDYQEWVNVGMALKHEGYSVDVWDEWSRADRRYHPGECQKKWESFNGASSPVTAGTLVQMAKERGMKTFEHKELSWDDEINYESELNLSTGEGLPFSEPENWNPVNEMITYLETLFDSSDNVGYVTETYEKDDNGKIKHLPTKGSCDRTAGELIELLNRCNGDVGSVFGDYKPEAGAWIRFNPLDGKGVKNENVTDFRYALVESDCMPVEEQNALIRELELPVALLIYSGGKSVHAIVKIDAPNYDEYRKRVDYLYNVCRENGLEIDRQNRNPSRLSRLPGVIRGDKKQFIMDKNIGKKDFTEWKDWIESINDNLPDFENLADYYDNPPDLAPPLIDGILRKGHKMLLAGPSKAGKSFALIELAIAIAEGKRWFGFDCAQGKVMYANLELDKASCYHRFIDVYESLGYKPDNAKNIEIWNLRGKSVPMDKLAPKLIRRAAKKDFTAIIIDPIYKVITGDENSADQMAAFCNQFDKLCTELGCAVIYCHHHSKGSQGSKRSMDRASGSGVFARDPDALLDLTELNVTDDVFIQQENREIISIIKERLVSWNIDPETCCSQDDLQNANAMLEIARQELDKQNNSAYDTMMAKYINPAKEAVRKRTAWRIEGTLREFPKLAPINLWFDYPIHYSDESDVLKDCKYAGEFDPKTNLHPKKTQEDRDKECISTIEIAFDSCQKNGVATVKELEKAINKSEDTVRRYLSKHGGFWVEKGRVGRKA